MVTSCPDLSRLLTMAEPIVPRPRNPIFSDVATTRFDQTLSDVVAGNMSGINCIAQTTTTVVQFNVPLDRIQVILGTSLTRQSTALVLTTKKGENRKSSMYNKLGMYRIVVSDYLAEYE